VRDEAVAVLSKAVPPGSGPEVETGLVIGYVQSGKTMSFTTVAALARDNGYPVVIVVAGTSDPLFQQSTDRLRTDLRLPSRPDRKWQHFGNPSLKGPARDAISDILADWDDPTVPDVERQTVLITVMKNHNHLNNLIQVLSGLSLQAVPVLIIDDEADQAGLNTQVKEGDESTTYRCLSQLRKIVPHHTFLQYTATPQAPLLINLIDVLSPKFAEVLTPGDEYAGGREFFLDNPGLVSTIPVLEVPTKTHIIHEPPQSLHYAMKLFFLGVAAGYVQDEGKGNRSMMVHPSQSTTLHKQYLHWVRQAKEQWREIVNLPPADSDRKELVEEFRAAYNDLSQTVAALPPFEVLLMRLPHAIRRTRVEEVNATPGKTPKIDWKAAYPFILVGGQAMDRGFTVEGLTVTYMPRGMGVGNADTVQQRARFFGYKRRYLGYCRVFLEGTVRNAFRHYVEHEEDIRRQLQGVRDEGKSLDEWKRAFFLHKMLRPTRSQVLDLDYMRDSYSDAWFRPDAPHASEDALEENRKIVDEFVATLSFKPDEGHKDRKPFMLHEVATGVPLATAFEELLLQLRFVNPKDSQKFTGLRLQLQAHLEQHPSATCRVYRMSPKETRRRKLTKDGGISNPFQGAYPVAPKERQGEIYPGDREIHATDEVTIQIYRLIVTEDGQDKIVDVPLVAVWVPAELARDWLVQRQGG